MAVILDGKETSNQIKEELKREIATLAQKGIRPGLAGVLVGEDAGSVGYIKLKEKAAQELGIRTRMVRLPAAISQGQLIEEIEKLNRDESLHGIFIQLPLPEHLDENEARETVLPGKDVDGLNPENAVTANTGQDDFLPATPLGIDEILRRYGYSPRGKRVVIVNTDKLVGRPLAAMWAPSAATVTVCPPEAHELLRYTQEADIIVTAANRPKLITADMVKKGVIAIDFGASYVPDAATGKAKLVGDLDFEGLREKAAAITPVPDGIGPMTVAMLMKNTVKAASIAAGLTGKG